MNILAIDPGETTGYVRARVVPSHPNIYVTIYNYGEWSGMEELTGLLDIFLGVQYYIIEDYRIYPNRIESHIGNRVYTAREIGRIEWICHYHHSRSESDGSVVFQMASQAVQRWPDQRMHNYVDFWPTRHIGDALRHLLTFIEIKDPDRKIVVNVPQNNRDWRTA